MLKGNYEGIDSLASNFQHNNITEPVKNLSEQSGSLGNLLEDMKAKRAFIDSNLENKPKTDNFDPMKSPINNQTQQYNDFFF